VYGNGAFYSLNARRKGRHVTIPLQIPTSPFYSVRLDILVWYAGSNEALHDLKTARNQSASNVKQNSSLRHTYSSPPQTSAIFVCFRERSVPESAHPLGIHSFPFRQGFQGMVADIGRVLLWTNSQRHVGCLPHSRIPRKNKSKSRRALRYLIRRNPPMSQRKCPP